MNRVVAANRLATVTRRIVGTGSALHANANALIVSTAVTSAAGLVFWAVAARWLPADAVGIGTALISVVTLLANLATLGLRNGLVRFLPAAGASTRRLVAGCYLTCAGAAVLLSAVFLVGQPRWAGHLDFLRDNALTVAVFTVSTVVWVLFVIQDDVLVGLRRSVWVPVENLAYAIAKIAVLPVLTVSAVWVVLAATVIPAAVAVLGVGLLLVRLTRPSEVGTAGGERIPVPQLARFAAADQTAWLISACTIPVLVLIVLEVEGPQASAYFYMANMIGYSLYLVTSNIGSALVAESVHDPARAAEHARTAVVHSARLVVPLAVVGVIAGPLVLRAFGAEYAAHAGTALQLIILSAIPQLVVGISISTARVRREMSTVVVTNLFLAVAIWGGSWLTLRWWGVTGVGATILAAYTLAALGLLLSGRTGLGTPAQTAVATWAPVARLSRAVRSLRERRARRRLVPRALTALSALGGSGSTALPVVRALKSDSDTLVAAVDTGSGAFVLKMATSDAADRNLARHVDTVATLRGHHGAPYVELLPRVSERITVGGHTVVRETLLPGRSPTDDPGPAAAAAITAVHADSVRSLMVSPALLEAWVEAPAAAVQRMIHGDRHAIEIDRIARYLRDGLVGQRVTAAGTHGDYWPGNVLVEEGPSGPELTGIVDWENHMDPGLPDADLAHWYLATRSADLGAAVCAVLDDPGRLTRYYEEVGVEAPNPHLGSALVVVFTWLWHVANTGTRATRRGPGRIWYSRSVTPVLRRFASDSRPEAGTARLFITRPLPVRPLPARLLTVDEVRRARHA